MSILANHVPVSIPVGSQTLGPFNVADNLSQFTLRIARCTTASPAIWPSPSTGVSLLCECSLDGGTMYQFIGGITSEGGIVAARGGGESFETVFGTKLPPGANRKVRATLVVSGSTLNTNVTIEAV